MPRFIKLNSFVSLITGLLRAYNMLMHYNSSSKGCNYVLFSKLIWPLNLLFTEYLLPFLEEQSLGNTILGIYISTLALNFEREMRYKTVLFHYRAIWEKLCNFFP